MFDTIQVFTTIDLNLRDISNWQYVKNDLTIYMYKSMSFKLLYYPISKCLHCTFSAPKIVHSDNTKMVYENDLDFISKRLTFMIREVIKKDIKEIRYWDVSRLDISYNFRVNRVEDKQLYINIAKKYHPSRMENRSYKTTAFYFNKSHSFKLYDKAEELRSRGVTTKPWQERIIRFEVTMRRKKIIEQFSKRLCNAITLEKLFRNDIAKEQLQKYLKLIRFNEKMNREEDINMIINNKIKTPSMKEKLKHFLHLLNTLGEKLLRKYIGNKKFISRVHKLKEIGIHSFIYLPDKISPIQFIIRFILDFDSLRYFSKDKNIYGTNYCLLYFRGG